LLLFSLVSNENRVSQKQRLVVVIGVSGCGKSTIAQAIAKQLNYEFVEADNFHSQENKDHMANGNALSDAMRKPWIGRLQTHLKQSANAGKSCVLSFSGLRRLHRAKIRDLPFNSVFIHLKGEQQLIADRINARSDHFMPASLLDSQYAALESPSNKESIISVDIDQNVESVITHSLEAVTQHFQN